MTVYVWSVVGYTVLQRREHRLQLFFLLVSADDESDGRISEQGSARNVTANFKMLQSERREQAAGGQKPQR